MTLDLPPNLFFVLFLLSLDNMEAKAPLHSIETPLQTCHSASRALETDSSYSPAV